MSLTDAKLRYNKHSKCTLCDAECDLFSGKVDCTRCNVPVVHYLKAINDSIFSMTVRL